ncbi:MAG: Rrf2 family transcriptional regulator [Bacteroidota bacterium]
MQKIINISEATSIAIHSMVAIASNDRINAFEIAKVTKFSKNHISKVLQQVGKSGLIKSERGPSGGFSLAKPADEITLLDIYQIMEGSSNEEMCCNEKDHTCPFKTCVFGGLTNRFAKEFIEYLRNKKLSDLI